MTSPWTPRAPQLFECIHCGATLPKERMVQNRHTGNWRCRDHVSCMMREKAK